MNSSHYYAYAFLSGLFIGGYSNFFSKVIISGLVIYIVHPDNFNPSRFAPLYNRTYENIYPYISKVYQIEAPINTHLQITEVTYPISSQLKLLPPLTECIKLKIKN